MNQESHLLSVQELKTYFYTFDGVAKAVDDVSFTLDKGETVGIVGESGCGKSVTAQSVMRLIPDPPGKIVHGSIRFDNTDILGLTLDSMRSIRGKRISMIFQEPMTSLNPVFTIGDQIAEMFVLHEKLSPRQALQQAIAMLQKVQVPVTEPSLGMMISSGKYYIYAGMWWMIVFPGAVLVMLVVGINLFADWLREELNPRLERKG